MHDEPVETSQTTDEQTNNQFLDLSGLCASFMAVSWYSSLPFVRRAAPLKCNKIKCRGFSRFRLDSLIAGGYRYPYPLLGKGGAEAAGPSMVWSMQKKETRAKLAKIDWTKNSPESGLHCVWSRKAAKTGWATPSGDLVRGWCTVTARPFPWTSPARWCFIDLLLLCGIYCGIRRPAFFPSNSCWPKSRQTSSRVAGNGPWIASCFGGRRHKPLKLVSLFPAKIFCFVFIFVPSFGFCRL